MSEWGYAAELKRGLFDQPRFGAVARQNLRLVLSDVSKAAFEGFGDASVQGTSRLAQKGAIRRILDQRVLKEITRMRRLQCYRVGRRAGECGFQLWTRGPHHPPLTQWREPQIVLQR